MKKFKLSILKDSQLKCFLKGRFFFFTLLLFMLRLKSLKATCMHIKDLKRCYKVSK